MMEQQFQYYAFISYKREDEKWAKWLQDRLRWYKLPSKLCRQITRLPKKYGLFSGIIRISTVGDWKKI